MSKKAYSEQERTEIKQKLVTAGLTLFANEGFKNVRLVDIVREAGISKPFFYTFYSSMEEFLLRVLNYQYSIIRDLMYKELSNDDASLDVRLTSFFDKLIHSRQHGFFIMTQDEQVAVKSRLSASNYETFQKSQHQLYCEFVDKIGISQHKCDPDVIGNTILSTILVYNSADKAMPFLFTDKLEATARLQVHMLVSYLVSLAE